MDIDTENLIKDLEKVKIERKKFTFLDVIQKCKDENIVSNWLEFLFNPEKNENAIEHLKALLEAVNQKYGQNYNIKEQDFRDIKRENSTSNKKRMDLIIKFSNLWIVIENKIDAFEHGNQTMEYFKYIERQKEYEDVCYIYLKPDWNASVPKQKDFKIITYGELLDNFEKIEKKDFYLEKFIEVGKEYYIGMQEIKINRENVEIYVKYKTKIDDITKNYNEYVKSVVEKIIKDIEQKLDWGEEFFSNNNNFMTAYTRIYSIW